MPGSASAVDNSGIPAATAAGVVVVNAPTGNTVSTAEHTIGLMLALARHIPQAGASLHDGKWERSRFVGTEVRNTTLAIIGIGQVGSASVGGTIEHGCPHIVLINDLLVDIAASDAWLLIGENEDRPGTIGAIGTLLGKMDVNISSMRVGRTSKRSRALMVLEVDEPLSDEHLVAMLKLPTIESARIARLDPRGR